MEIQVLPNHEGRWLEWVGPAPGVPPELWPSPSNPARARSKYMEWLGLNPDGSPSDDPEVLAAAAADASPVPCVFHAKVVVEGTPSRPSGYVSRRPPRNMNPYSRFPNGGVWELNFVKVGPDRWEATVDIWIDSRASSLDTPDALAKMDFVIWDRKGEEWHVQTVPLRIVHTRLRPRQYSEETEPLLMDFAKGLLIENANEYINALLPFDRDKLIQFMVDVGAEILPSTVSGGDSKVIHVDREFLESVARAFSRKQLLAGFKDWLSSNWDRVSPMVKAVVTPFLSSNHDHWSSYFNFYADVAKSVRQLAAPMLVDAYISDVLAGRMGFVQDLLPWAPFLGVVAKAAGGDIAEQAVPHPLQWLLEDPKTKDLYYALFESGTANLPSMIMESEVPDSPYAVDGKVYWFQDGTGLYALTPYGPAEIDKAAQPMPTADSLFWEDIALIEAQASEPTQPRTEADQTADSELESAESPGRVVLEGDVKEAIIAQLVARFSDIAYILEHYPEAVDCSALSRYLWKENVFSYLTGKIIPTTAQLAAIRGPVGRIVDLWAAKCEDKFSPCHDLLEQIARVADAEDLTPDQLNAYYLLVLGCQQYQWVYGELPWYFKTPIAYGIYKILRPMGKLRTFTDESELYHGARDPIWREAFADLVELASGDLVKASEIQRQLMEIQAKVAAGQELTEEELQLVKDVFNSDQVQREFRGPLWQLSQVILAALGEAEPSNPDYIPEQEALLTITSKLGELDRQQVVELALDRIQEKLTQSGYQLTEVDLQSFRQTLNSNWMLVASKLLIDAFNDHVVHGEEATPIGRLAEFNRTVKELDEEDVAEALASTATVRYVVDLGTLTEETVQVIHEVIEGIRDSIRSGGEFFYRLPEDVVQKAGLDESSSTFAIKVDASDREEALRVLDRMETELTGTALQTIMSLSIPEDISPFPPADPYRLSDWGKQSRREVKQAVASIYKEAIERVIREFKWRYRADSPWGADRVLELLKYQLIGWTFFPTLDPGTRFGGAPFFPFVGEWAHMGQRVLVRGVLGFLGASYFLFKSLVGR